MDRGSANTTPRLPHILETLLAVLEISLQGKTKVDFKADNKHLSFTLLAATPREPNSCGPATGGQQGVRRPEKFVCSGRRDLYKLKGGVWDYQSRASWRPTPRPPLCGNDGNCTIAPVGRRDFCVHRIERSARKGLLDSYRRVEAHGTHGLISGVKGSRPAK